MTLKSNQRGKCHEERRGGYVVYAGEKQRYYPTGSGGSCRNERAHRSAVRARGEVAQPAQTAADLENARGPVRGGLELGGGATPTRSSVAGSDPVCAAVRQASGQIPPDAGAHVATAYSGLEGDRRLRQGRVF